MPTPNSQHISDNVSVGTSEQLIHNLQYVPKEIVIGDKFKVSTLEYDNNLQTLYGQTIENAANSIVFVKHNNAYTLWIVDKNCHIFPVQFYDATSLINNYMSDLTTDLIHTRI